MVHALYKDVFGTDARGPYAINNIGIRVNAYFNNALHNDCFIINQKGARQYKVQDTSSGEKAKCKLVEILGTENNTMILVGYLASSIPPGQLDPNGSGITLSKLQKRTAIDWNENRYTWRLVNDSSVDYIELTPIS